MKLSLRNVSFSYNKKQKKIINDFSYDFLCGKCYVLKGPNGSGKTTLSKLICGIEKKYSGEILFDDECIKKNSIGKIAKKIGYLFQKPSMQLFADTVEEELAFPYKLTDTYSAELEIEIDNILSKFDLKKYKNSNPLLLSEGEKQKLALATVFLRKVKFIILDEPSSSIDFEAKQFLANIINEFVKTGGGAIIITHDDQFENLLFVEDNIEFEGGKDET